MTLLSAAPAAPIAWAQSTTGPTVFYSGPGTQKLATVTQGTVVAPAGQSGKYLRVILRGYIATSLLGGPSDSFATRVTGTDARLRTSASTSAPVAAALEQGVGFHVVKRGGGWTKVERAGWILRSALPATLPADPAPSVLHLAPPAQIKQSPVAPPVTPATPDTTPPGAGQAGDVTPVGTTGLAPAPDVAPVATVQHGAVLTPLARERGWVRVRLEGWVREADVAAADSSLARLSAADLRASPQQYVGRTVRWTVTSLAFQTADALRHDMKPDEPYLLARGPGAETSLLYLALPPDLVARAQALPPMAQLIITATVRTGRSDPAGVPILDVSSMTTR
ncbi:MAG: SH3 domain-containing protein [Gemmatimonadaceae bacterium]